MLWPTVMMYVYASCCARKVDGVVTGVMRKEESDSSVQDPETEGGWCGWRWSLLLILCAEAVSRVIMMEDSCCCVCVCEIGYMRRAAMMLLPEKYGTLSGKISLQKQSSL